MEKLLSLKKLKTETRALQRAGKKIVFTNGCFDIIHAGHVRYLRKAKACGDVLVVGLNSDSSVRKIKGERRPIVRERERAEVLGALSSVDYVVMFSEPTPIKLIATLIPDVLVKGADWAEKNIVGADIVKKNRGRLARIRLAKGRSTTNIIKRILRTHAPNKF
ncbi:MAG: D-glycero-beta-D-manno-heptose 1-phosphate adenylyltransferase [Deltaproteobacteria bacterium]|nr:D-glycero-beta-D-manno-heptose 1-phosphate adenylyltransferase [Deltaproteobacteria bacterium]